MQELDFENKDRHHFENVVADHLSRLSTKISTLIYDVFSISTFKKLKENLYHAMHT